MSLLLLFCVVTQTNELGIEHLQQWQSTWLSEKKLVQEH